MKHHLIHSLAALALSLVSASVALAQTSPNWTFGQVPTVAQWNAVFAGKQDYLGVPPVLTTGGTMTGPLATAASSTERAGLNVAPGVAPTGPSNGDIWATVAGLFAHVAGATVGPIGSGVQSTLTITTTAPLRIDDGPSADLSANRTLSIAGAAAGQILAGATPAFTATPTLGASGTLGSVTFGNATSGLLTLRPVTGALGTVTVSLPAGDDTLVGKATADTFTNKTFDTAGTGNSFLINGVAVTADTGTGAVARAASPTFTAPTLGVATATSYSLAANLALGEAGGFHVVYAPDGRLALRLGPVGDPTNYHRSANHSFTSSTGAVTFVHINSEGLRLYGSASGNLVLSAPATAGTSSIKFPAGTTDFSATGGTGRFVKQNTAGAALTVAALATSDLGYASVDGAVMYTASAAFAKLDPPVTSNLCLLSVANAPPVYGVCSGGTTALAGYGITVTSPGGNTTINAPYTGLTAPFLLGSAF